MAEATEEKNKENGAEEEKNEERNVSCDQGAKRGTAVIKSRRRRWQGRLRQHFAPLSELRGHPRHRRPSEDESISRMNRH